MVTVKIDGIEVQVEPNTTILDAAEKAGVHIPVLCHHKSLNPFGACRVCLVEVKNNPKLMTACTTPVMDKMEITTQNDKLQRLRKSVIELLLINHPLDCPVCDKGGDCMLQNLTFEVGLTNVRFDPKPNDTPFDHTNPFIERDIDRCVLCGKCVRICDEVVNIQAISFINRGTETYIGTSFDQPWNCEYCGQCMSVCPVGSLNNRVYLFKNRPWNLEKTNSVCGLCSCGCSIVLEHEDNEVYKVAEDVELGVNHGFLCSKGRFGFELINAPERGKKALIKRKDELSESSFEEAVAYVSSKINEIKAKDGGKALGILVSPRITNEEAYAAQKLARDVIGTGKVYSFENDSALPDANYADIEASDSLLVFNIDVTESNPVLGYAIRKASRKEENTLTVFYPKTTALKRVATNFFTGKPSDVYGKMDIFLEGLEGKGELKDIAEGFKNAKNPLMVYNPYDEADLYYVQEVRKAVPNLKTVPCKIKNNSQGIVDMGCLNGLKPGYESYDKSQDLLKALESGELKGLIVFGENIFAHHEYCNLGNMLEKLDLLVVTDPFMSEVAKMADVYLPVALFAEKEGTFTNFEGRVQSIHKAVDNDVNTDLNFISKLAEKLGGSIPCDVAEIQSEIRKNIQLYSDVDFEGGLVKYPYILKGEFGQKKVLAKGKGKYKLYPAYLRLHSGTFTRRSKDLTKVYAEPAVEICPKDAGELNVDDGDYLTLKFEDVSKKFRVSIDRGMPAGVISIPPDYVETASLFNKGRYLKVDLVKHSK